MNRGTWKKPASQGAEEQKFNVISKGTTDRGRWKVPHEDLSRGGQYACAIDFSTFKS